MKKHKILILALVGLMVSIYSCESDDSDRILLDVNDPANAIAQVQTTNLILIDPTADTNNNITVGVSTLSNVDRAFTLSVDPTSTLDASFYNIPSLTGVVPAGEFEGSITLTTFATTTFPNAGSSVTFTLDSFEGAALLPSSTLTVDVGFQVQCPSVDLANVTGTGTYTLNVLAAAFGAPTTGDPVDVLAGPGENQLTIVGGVNVAGRASEDVIINVDPDSGAVSYGGPADAVLVIFNGGPVNHSSVTGLALTCINTIDIVLNNTFFAAPFNSNAMTIVFP
ncbi:hypothetical protein D7030_00370 [Flavobacteriaceae bacterium AU392]|nr:hypothetical protein D1817_14065 [Flavobacteriaceae bacterium]RKM86987.1 hypothetical protein D7030_00370 [Flavobacteriaceae bacterium AU392]